MAYFAKNQLLFKKKYSEGNVKNVFFLIFFRNLKNL